MKQGVKTLTVGGLHLQFGEPTAERTVEAAPAPLPQVDHAKLSKEALVQDELRAREDQIAMLPLEDPVLMEALIANGELEEMVEDEDDGEFESDGLHDSGASGESASGATG